MLVMEKTRDIAILKAMGATTSSIRNLCHGGVLDLHLGNDSGTPGWVCARQPFEEIPFIELPAMSTIFRPSP